MTLEVGQLAPDFTAVDQHGQSHTLESYQGQWLVLYFYPEDDTPGCTQEACSFRDMLGELSQVASVVGVSQDSSESHSKFASKYQLSFPLLSDPNHELIKAYGADGLIFKKRVTFLIDPNGRVAKIYPKVNVKTHAGQVLRDVKKLSK